MSKLQFFLLEAPIEKSGTPWENEEGQMVAIVTYAESEAEAKKIATDEHIIDWNRDDVRVTILDETYSGDATVIVDVSFPSMYGRRTLGK